MDDQWVDATQVKPLPADGWVSAEDIKPHPDEPQVTVSAADLEGQFNRPLLMRNAAANQAAAGRRPVIKLPQSRINRPTPKETAGELQPPPNLKEKLFPQTDTTAFGRMDPAEVGGLIGMTVLPEVFGPAETAPLLVRLGTRMGLAGVGGGVGRGITEAATPDLDPTRAGTPAGRAAKDMVMGAGLEGAGGVIHTAQAVRGTLGAAEDLAFQKTTEGGIPTPPPSAMDVAHKILIEPLETTLINKLMGPPTVMKPDLVKGLPGVDVGQYMGGDATAAQVRSSKLGTGLESWIRSTFAGRPITAQTEAADRKLQRDVEDIVSPFGPAPTDREAGQALLAPERQQIRSELDRTTQGIDRQHQTDLTGVEQSHIDDQAKAEAYHGAIIRQRKAEETAARYQQEAAEASLKGDHQKYLDLSAERDRLLMQAQQASEEARHIREGIYGAMGPVRTAEEAGTITRNIHTAVEDARDKAVDEAYAHVDQLARDKGVQVDLTNLMGRAQGIQGKTSTLQTGVNPPPTTLTGRVIEGSQIPEEDGGGNVAEAVKAQKAIQASPQQIRELIASGKYRTNQELLDAVLSANDVETTGGAQSISFTQARRVKSDLGRIVWRNKDTNPALSATARRLKTTLEKSMSEAADAAGSEAHTALQAADKLYGTTKQVFEEGVLSDLAGKDAHQAVHYLLSRDSKEIATVFSELGPEVQQALRSALVDATLKDPATNAWRTGKQLQQALGRIRPEVRQVMFDDLNPAMSGVTSRTIAGESAVGRAGGVVKEAEKARTTAIGTGVRAMKAEAETAGAAQKTQQAKEAYQTALREAAQKAAAGKETADVKAAEALGKAQGTAAEQEGKLDAVGAFRTLITPGTDAPALALRRQQVTEMLGPKAWGQVQARWLHDQLGSDLPGLLDRLQKYRPEVIKELIPDTQLRNRVYQLARVAEHLATSSPKVYPNVFMRHLSTLAGLGGATGLAVATGHPIAATGIAATSAFEGLSPMVVAKILSDSHAGPAFIAGMKAGSLTDTATAAKLAGEVARFLRREGIGGTTAPTPPPSVGGPGPNRGLQGPPSVAGRVGG